MKTKKCSWETCSNKGVVTVLTSSRTNTLPACRKHKRSYEALLRRARNFVSRPDDTEMLDWLLASGYLAGLAYPARKPSRARIYKAMLLNGWMSDDLG